MSSKYNKSFFLFNSNDLCKLDHDAEIFLKVEKFSSVNIKRDSKNEECYAQ